MLRTRAVSSSRLGSVRSAHDLSIINKPGSSTPSPIIKHGPPTGGRSSVSGHTVTVFGCTGFLGRYLVHKLAKQGTRVIVPYRDEDEKRHLRVMGDLGQIVPMEWDVRNPEQIHECLKHSQTVYNLVGRDWQTRNFTYEDVNVTAAKTIAEIAAQSDTARLIHVSHLNASPDSASEFYRSKYAGERAVRDAFPEATIVRPGQLFGPEDWLLNGIAQYPILFKLNGGNTKLLPVHVLDVAQAMSTMLTAPVASVASTFALAGPDLHTYNSLQALVSAMTYKPISSAPDLPKPIAKLIATALNRGLWWPTISPDEIERKYIDDIGVEAYSPQTENQPTGWAKAHVIGGLKGIDGEDVKGWAELDITPETVEEHAIKYLRRYRSAATYDLPVDLGDLKAPKQYHVVD
ncbi:NADH dehydrogenase (ubiquinone) 1 alpha subcomplex subunit 9, partial [Tremellales sp. Uapishka_1]